MPLYWLIYRHNSIVIKPARPSSAIAGLDQGEFTEGHALDAKWKVPKEMIGRRLTQTEAKRLLDKFT